MCLVEEGVKVLWVPGREEGVKVPVIEPSGLEVL